MQPVSDRSLSYFMKHSLQGIIILMWIHLLIERKRSRLGLGVHVLTHVLVLYKVCNRQISLQQRIILWFYFSTHARSIRYRTTRTNCKQTNLNDVGCRTGRHPAWTIVPAAVSCVYPRVPASKHSLPRRARPAVWPPCCRPCLPTPAAAGKAAGTGWSWLGPSELRDCPGSGPSINETALLVVAPEPDEKELFTI